jgi:hypothetical protein
MMLLEPLQLPEAVQLVAGSPDMYQVRVILFGAEPLTGFKDATRSTTIGFTGWVKLTLQFEACPAESDNLTT